MRLSKYKNVARLATTFTLCAALAVMTPATAFATPADDAQAQANEALAKLDELNGVLQQAENDYYAAMQATEEATNRVNEAQEKIESATARIGQLQDKLGDRVRSMYRTGSSSILDLLLGATSFEELATNWNLLERLNQSDADLVAETKTLRQEVEEEKVVLVEQQKLAEQHQAEAEAVMASAAEAQAAMQATYDSLSAEAAALLEQERAAREAAEAAAASSVVEEATSNDSGASYNAPAYDVVTGNAVVDRAYSWVGRAEYVWGGCSPGAFDCSGFVSYCLTGSYSRLGTTYTFLTWPRTNDPQPGDVAVNSGHTGIYIGGGQMIHCATYGVGVIVGPVQSGMVFVRY